MRLGASDPFQPTIGEILGGELRRESLGSTPAQVSEADPGQLGDFRMELKRKRQSALLREMLKSGGYDDLAKMVAIRRETEE